MNQKTKEAKCQGLNDTFQQYPNNYRRYCEIKDGKLVGGLEFAVYVPLACGCEVTGNGTLQFPLTVNPCKKHKAKGGAK